MRNRAKCKKCHSIIESLATSDRVTCQCGEISIDGGNNNYLCYANDFDNFIRVDDQDNEIIVTVKDKSKEDPQYSEKPSKKDLINMLDDMIKSIDNLPEHAKLLSINNYDFASLLILLSALFKADRDNDN
jgi:hypothetical protein